MDIYKSLIFFNVHLWKSELQRSKQSPIFVYITKTNGFSSVSTGPEIMISICIFQIISFIKYSPFWKKANCLSSENILCASFAAAAGQLWLHSSDYISVLRYVANRFFLYITHLLLDSMVYVTNDIYNKKTLHFSSLTSV